MLQSKFTCKIIPYIIIRKLKYICDKSKTEIYKNYNFFYLQTNAIKKKKFFPESRIFKMTLIKPPVNLQSILTSQWGVTDESHGHNTPILSLIN